MTALRNQECSIRRGRRRRRFSESRSIKLEQLRPARSLLLQGWIAPVSSLDLQATRYLAARAASRAARRACSRRSATFSDDLSVRPCPESLRMTSAKSTGTTAAGLAILGFTDAMGRLATAFAGLGIAESCHSRSLIGRCNLRGHDPQKLHELNDFERFQGRERHPLRTPPGLPCATAPPLPGWRVDSPA